MTSFDKQKVALYHWQQVKFGQKYFLVLVGT